MRKAEPIAGFGGMLLFVSLFLQWYDASLQLPDSTARGGARLTGWEAFAVIDVLLALIALLALAIPAVSAVARGPAAPIAIEVIASVLTAIGVLIVAFRLLFPPGDELSLDVGAWVGLAGALIAFAGSWLSMADESTPGAVAPDVPRRPAPPAA
jgi:uncharacterized membrane protein